jgi:hypothetical protein
MGWLALIRGTLSIVRIFSMTTLYRPALVAALFALAACSGGAGTSTVPGSQPGNQTSVRSLQSAGGGATWQVFNANNSVKPAGTALAAFPFSTKTNVTLLVTENDKSKNPFLGNHLHQTVTAVFSISGTNPGTTFTYDTTNNPCGSPASVRIRFTSTSGPFAYTDYWWADAAGSITLAPGGPVTLQVKIEPADPLNPWSDWNGQPSAANAAAFNAAASNITSVGLSFGGGCFFENGVGTSDGSGVFTLNSFSIS